MMIEGMLASLLLAKEEEEKEISAKVAQECQRIYIIRPHTRTGSSHCVQCNVRFDSFDCVCVC